MWLLIGVVGSAAAGIGWALSRMRDTKKVVSSGPFKGCSAAHIDGIARRFDR